MLPNSAYAIVPIVKGTDYSVLNNPIYALLCIKSSGVAPVTIQALGNPDTSPEGVIMTADVFKVGVVYYIYLKRLIDDASGTVAFVGYQYPSRPMIL